MRITLITGADGAPFTHALASLLDRDDELTVVVPTVRDRWSAWLKACPDLDAVLAPRDVAPTFAVADQLAAIDYAAPRVSDQVVATRLVRTELLGTGYSLTEATIAAATRAGAGFRLLPVSDDRAELHVVVGPEPHAIHVGEYLGDPAAHEPTETVLVAEAWSASETVLAALRETEVLVLGPSSRTLAIDPVLRAPGVLEAIDADLPVLVVEHSDTAPEALVRVAGLRETDPGVAEPVAADPAAVLARAREVVGR
ncbi:MAG: 2-phospho-L-lactate transferase CofD family protein [Aeromicrobium sp.]